VAELAQYKVDCLRKLIDTDLICTVDSSSPGATECSATMPDGTVNAYTMDTLIFECKDFQYGVGGPSGIGCPLDYADFKTATEYPIQTDATACPVDSPMVTGYEFCEKKVVCAHKTADATSGIGVDKLVSFEKYRYPFIHKFHMRLQGIDRVIDHVIEQKLFIFRGDIETAF
jgi:hypothetical protein